MNALEAHMRAMCRLLEGDGHMTPIATRQILAVVAAHPTTPPNPSPKPIPGESDTATPMERPEGALDEGKRA